MNIYSNLQDISILRFKLISPRDLLPVAPQISAHNLLIGHVISRIFKVHGGTYKLYNFLFFFLD